MKLLRLMLFFSILVLFLSACIPRESAKIRNLYTASGSTIVCFGDSLTAGQGATAGGTYPSYLAKKMPLKVINAGLSGDTTSNALKRIRGDVLAHDPRIVIVELGANDFLMSAGQPEVVRKTFKNLGVIVDKIQSYGAVVVLVGFSINYDLEQHYKEFAREKGVVLIPNIMANIPRDSKHMADVLHPNDKGYGIMAKDISEVLIPLLQEMDQAR